MASIAAMGSGSVTSPMPQRISLLAASGWDSANAFTRRPISGNKYPACNLRKLSLMLGMVLIVSASFHTRNGTESRPRSGMPSFPASRNGATSPPCRSFLRAKAAAPAPLRVHAPRRPPVLPDSPELLPGKIPKTGQADAQQRNPFILRGIMALKKPASFVPRSASVLLLKPELPGT